MAISQKPRLYLHIGYHKTGTTAIQHGLYHSRDTLAQHGYFYPQTGLVGYGQHDISAALQIGKRTDIVEQLLKEMANSHSSNFIISSETFCVCNTPQIKQLGGIFSAYETKIIVYLRRQDQLLQAVWAQLVKTGKETARFEEWVSNYLYKPDMRKDTNKVPPLIYHQALTEWADVFGKKNLVVRPYERGQFTADILIDFLMACDLQDCSPVHKAPITNVTPSLKTLEIIRAVTVSMAPELPDKPLRFENVKILYALIRDYADKQGWNKDKLNLITPELYQQIMHEFDESNRSVAKQYLGQSQLFYDPVPNGQTQDYDLATTGGLEILDLLVPILAEMTHRVIDRDHQLAQLEQRVNTIGTYSGLIYLAYKFPVLYRSLAFGVKIKRKLHRKLRPNGKTK